MSGGVMTCTSPGTGASQCGAGITQGEHCSLQYGLRERFAGADPRGHRRGR